MGTIKARSHQMRFANAQCILLTDSKVSLIYLLREKMT
jgi:hypothetical protein